MRENPDSIEEFLKTLDLSGLGEEQPIRQAKEYDVGVMFSWLENRYYLNCFILDQATIEDLPGQLLSDQFLFPKTTLPDLCGKIEKSLKGYGLAYSSDVPRGLIGPKHTHIFYKLEPRRNDPQSKTLLQLTVAIVGALYMEHEKGH